jgi:hypothetical protein
MNLIDIDANDEIPSAQVPPTLPTTTPSSQSSSSTPSDANTNAASSSTPIDAASSSTLNNVNANSNTLALPLVGTTNNSTCYHQRQLMPEPKTRLKVRKSQRVQTLRE